MTLTFRHTAIPAGMSGIALLAFALGWWGGDDGARRSTASVADAGWMLPKSNASDVSTSAQILAQKAPFGALPANPVPTAPQPAGAGTASTIEWRVGGIVTTEASRHLIILIRRTGENTTRSEIRHAGEALPDGSIVRTVEPTNVTIDRQGATVTIKMFAQH
jgi:hypothetical protein